VNASATITHCSVLTPLDIPGGATTWGALCADQRITEQVAIRDEFLPEDSTLDRSIRLALAAVERLNVNVQDCQLFCGTSKGPITTFLAAAENTRRGESLTESQATHLALGVGAMGALLRDRLKISAPAHTSVAACSSGLHALHRAVTAVRRGECRRALVVAADASLHPLFEGSFTRLGVLAPADANGIRRCDPFSEEGNGFFLIEAAAALVIENSEFRVQNSEWPQIEQSWIGADSTGLIAIDEQTRTLRTALRSFAGEAPAFIHAHATGTAHDQYELAAIQSVFPNTPVFSHKQWLGHSLGAAALVSVALSALSHRARRTPTGTAVSADARSLTISQGFGGHIGVIALKSPCASTESRRHASGV